MALRLLRKPLRALHIQQPQQERSRVMWKGLVPAWKIPKLHITHLNTRIAPHCLTNYYSTKSTHAKPPIPPPNMASHIHGTNSSTPSPTDPPPLKSSSKPTPARRSPDSSPTNTSETTESSPSSTSNPLPIHSDTPSSESPSPKKQRKPPPSSPSPPALSSPTVVVDMSSNSTSPFSPYSPFASPLAEGSLGYTSLQDLKALGTLTEWGDLLTPYIVTPKSYYPHIVRYYDEHSVVISDKYPKAKHHLLVMPSIEVYGFDCLTIDNVPMLEEMRDRGLALIEEVRSKEPELSFRMGFHAIPSLKQLHMHVISQDFNAPGLKNKKHWNSFNTDFFVDANLFINTLQTQGYIFLDKEYYEKVMREPMRCSKCGEEFRGLPKLKSHSTTCGTEEDSESGTAMEDSKSGDSKSTSEEQQ